MQHCYKISAISIAKLLESYCELLNLPKNELELTKALKDYFIIDNLRNGMYLETLGS